MVNITWVYTDTQILVLFSMHTQIGVCCYGDKLVVAVGVWHDGGIGEIQLDLLLCDLVRVGGCGCVCVCWVGVSIKRICEPTHTQTPSHTHTHTHTPSLSLTAHTITQAQTPTHPPPLPPPPPTHTHTHPHSLHGCTHCYVSELLN